MMPTQNCARFGLSVYDSEAEYCTKEEDSGHCALFGLSVYDSEAEYCTKEEDSAYYYPVGT